VFLLLLSPMGEKGSSKWFLTLEKGAKRGRDLTQPLRGLSSPASLQSKAQIAYFAGEPG